MRIILLVTLTLLGLSACQDEDRPEVDPSVFDNAEAACTRAGGDWVARAGSTGRICQRKPRDAGQACSASTDCEGLCLARSRTCAPVIPLFGCNDVLGRNGAQSTVCLQ